MSDTLLLAERIAGLAIQHWPCITEVPQLFMHRENSVFKTSTVFGPAALRVHRHGYHDRQAIESELLWMAHLAENGLRVPQPLANSDGSYLSEVIVDGRVWIVDLLTWIDGTPLGDSVSPLAYGKDALKQIFFNVGAGISALHTVSDAWTLPARFKRHAWDRDGFLGPQAFWGAFWNAADLSEGERSVLQKARAKAIAELDLLKDAGADYGLIHADFVRQNILVRGVDVCFIDFDDSGFGFRMYDIATALVKNRDEPLYDTIKQALFDGYRSKRNLSEQDERSLALFLTLRDFAYLGWMTARKDEPGVSPRLAKVKTDAIVAARVFLNSPSVI